MKFYVTAKESTPRQESTGIRLSAFDTCVLMYCINVCFLGDVEIGMMERNGQLEVEIIKARGLIMKPGSRGPPGESPIKKNSDFYRLLFQAHAWIDIS